jgi:hypothetical protein
VFIREAGPRAKSQGPRANGQEPTAKTKDLRRKTQMQKTYFKEEQCFSNPLFWVFLIIVITFFLAPTCITIYSQVVLGKTAGNNLSSTDSLLIILAISLVVYTFVILMFRKMRLITEVRKDGIFYSYPPFIVKERQFQQSEIQKFKIRKYKPISEYCGWGIRYSRVSGKAFNVKGNIGLQLYLKNGKRVLFGTQRSEALLRAMNKIMKGD